MVLLQEFREIEDSDAIFLTLRREKWWIGKGIQDVDDHSVDQIEMIRNRGNGGNCLFLRFCELRNGNPAMSAMYFFIFVLKKRVNDVAGSIPGMLPAA